MRNDISANLNQGLFNQSFGPSAAATTIGPAMFMSMMTGAPMSQVYQSGMFDSTGSSFRDVSSAVTKSGFNPLESSYPAAPTSRISSDKGMGGLNSFSRSERRDVIQALSSLSSGGGKGLRMSPYGVYKKAKEPDNLASKSRAEQKGRN